MDFLDVVILGLLVAAVFWGWRRGLTWVFPSLVGLLVGVVLGALIVPPIVKAISPHQLSTQALLGSTIFLAVVFLVQGIGTAIGYRARMATLMRGHAIARADSWIGAVCAVMATLVTTWYVGLAFADSPSATVDSQVQDSAILQALDSIAPRPPGFLASIQQLIRGSAFPNPFAGLQPQLMGPVTVPPSADSSGIQLATSVTSKVISRGCANTISIGSGWPVGRDYMVTNAHVVAGGQGITVRKQGVGRPFRATVVLFDPEVDIAVLHVPGIGLSPLTVAAQDPARGTTGAVIGYPGGGREITVPAAVRGTESAQGRDIYGTNLVTRTIEVLQAQVIPGDSGGPFVDQSGTVIGLVFATSTIDPTEGFSLAVSQITPDINAGMGRLAPVSTESCAQ